MDGGFSLLESYSIMIKKKKLLSFVFPISGISSFSLQEEEYRILPVPWFKISARRAHLPAEVLGWERARSKLSTRSMRSRNNSQSPIWPDGEWGGGYPGEWELSAGSASSHKALQGTGRIWAPACRRRGAVKTLSNGWTKMMFFKELLSMQREKSYLYNGETGQIAPSPSDQGRHQWRHVDTMYHPIRGTRYASNTISYGVSTKRKLAPQMLFFFFYHK